MEYMLCLYIWNLDKYVFCVNLLKTYQKTSYIYIYFIYVKYYDLLTKLFF